MNASARRYGLTFTFVLVVSSSVLYAEDAKPLAAQRLHLTAKVHAAPKVKIVFEGEPTEPARAWADEAGPLVTEWWPQIARLLSTENFQSPAEMVLTFKRDMDGPGYRTRSGIVIGVPWITAHPGDFGMLIHEMTHAIQDYRRAPREATWLVEGIADYIRYWHYEPELPRPRIDTARASYRDGYGTTGAFLAWLMVKYDRRIVRELDAAFRAERYSNDCLKELTGKDLDTLWQEFVAEIKAN